MTVLANLTIRVKLITVFALILCCMAGLGAFVITRINDIVDQTVLVGSNVVAVDELSTISRDVQKLMALAAERHAAQSPAETTIVLRKVDEATQETVASWAKYVDTGIDAGEERRLADAAISAQQRFVATLHRLAELESAEAHEEARQFLLKDAQTASEQLSDTIDGSIAYQVHQGAAAVDTTANSGNATRSMTMVILGVLAIVCIGLGWLMVQTISKPVRAMTQAMRRLAAQELEIAIPGVGRRDEIGAMAAAVQVFKTNALEAQVQEQEQAATQARRSADDDRIRFEAEETAASAAANLVVGSIGAGLERLAAGDLTYRLETTLPEAYEQLRANLNTTMEQLEDVIGSIVTNTSGIRSGSEEITQASDDLSRRTEQQAASLEETAAALDQITTTVRKTADSAKHARDVVSRTRGDAEQSGEVVRQAISAMGEIEHSSEQISQIIGVIDEIAFQTNLLALNAGVEAARAGDAGRGFAVVASEVRALAQRSAGAAKEIKALISSSVQQVGAGVKLVGETGASLGRIVAQVVEIAAVVSEIAASTQEQASGLHEVNTAINQMDQITQQNAAMVEQSTAASHALAQETANLALLTQRFHIAGAVDPAMSVQPKRRRA